MPRNSKDTDQKPRVSSDDSPGEHVRPVSQFDSKRAGAHSYLQKKNIEQFIKSLQTSHASIFERMDFDENVQDWKQEDIVRFLLEELERETGPNCLTALQLICETAATLQENHFAINLPVAFQKDVVDAVSKKLGDSEPIVRKHAVVALVPFLPGCTEQIVKALTDNGIADADAETAKASIDLLGRAEINVRSLAVGSLAKALSNTDDGVREAACEALGELERDSLEAVPGLVQIAVSDAYNHVRIAATLSLLRILGHDRTVDEFQRSIKDWPSFLNYLRRWRVF